MTDETGNNASGFVTRAKSWMAKPFTEQMDIGHWALMCVFLTTVVILWIGIMNSIQSNLSE